MISSLAVRRTFRDGEVCGWVRVASAEEEPRSLPADLREGRQGLARARRARVSRMRRRGLEGQAGDGRRVPAPGQGETGRDGLFLVDRLQVARTPGPREREGHEGSSPCEDDGSESDAVRREAHGLWRFRDVRLNFLRGE